MHPNHQLMLRAHNAYTMLRCALMHTIPPDGNEEISADGGTVVSRLLAEFKAVETPYTDCLRHMAEVTRHGPHRKQLEDLADSVVNMYELMAG